MTGTNKQGQALGRKGAESRTRLLEGARRLVETAPSDPLTVSAIARAAGLASQSFYLYFKDVDELLLCLCRDVAKEIADIVAEVDTAWSPAEIDRHSERFVAAFYRYWDRNRAILNIRNFRADSGDAAFATTRNEGSMPIVHALARQIRAAGSKENLPERAALARAVIIVAAIERMASRYSTLQVAPAILDAEDLKRAEADILRLMLLPRTG